MRVMDTTRIMCHPLLSRLALQQRAVIGRGVTNRLAVMPPLTPLQPLAVLLVGKTCRRGGLFSIRCSPMKFKEIVAALGDTLKGQVVAKNFGGLLQFKPHELDRHLLSWLMRKLNPETMKLEIGGGKEIAIIEHSVWCVC